MEIKRFISYTSRKNCIKIMYCFQEFYPVVNKTLHTYM